MARWRTGAVGPRHSSNHQLESRPYNHRATKTSIIIMNTEPHLQEFNNLKLLIFHHIGGVVKNAGNLPFCSDGDLGFVIILLVKAFHLKPIVKKYLDNPLFGCGCQLGPIPSNTHTDASNL